MQITITLTPAPYVGRLAYLWTGVCPHGTSEQLLFGKRATIQEQAPKLAGSHRIAIQSGQCKCLLGQVLFASVDPTTVPEDLD